MSVSSNILKENFCDLLREEEPCDDEIESLINDDDEEFLTTSISVLLVDSDPKSSRLMKNLMTQFSYSVTNYENGDEAIAFLMKSKHVIDLVIWDFHIPEINGLEALNTIHKEMDLPVVIMSHDHKKETVMKSTKYGACDFLVKPVSKEVIAVLWRHVFYKRMLKPGSDKPDESNSVESDPVEDDGLEQDNNDLYQSNEEGSKNGDYSGEQITSDKKGDRSSSKKPRMTWTPELHQKFEKAVEIIGSLEKAVPKQILKCMQEEMNVEGLTRNNVASHLQKYRQNAGKNHGPPQETGQVLSGWRNAGSNASLAAAKPLLNSSINLHARVPYYMNGQAAANAQIQQYPSTSYLTMNNNHFINNPNLANMPYYIDQHHHQPQQQQQQQQHYYDPSLQLPSVINKQEPGQDSSAMENPVLIYDPNIPFDPREYFPTGYNNFDQIGR